MHSTPRNKKWHCDVYDNRESSNILRHENKIKYKRLHRSRLVALDDLMAHILQTRYFLAVRGYHIPTKTIYQDNKSTRLPAETGEKSKSGILPYKKVCWPIFTKSLQGAYIKKAEHDIESAWHKKTSMTCTELCWRKIKANITHRKRKYEMRKDKRFLRNLK